MPNELKTPLEASELKSIEPRTLYTPADLQGWYYDRDAGYPGEFPFTRGVQATMYRGRLWTMRQYAGMGDAEESSSCEARTAAQIFGLASWNVLVVT